MYFSSMGVAHSKIDMYEQYADIEYLCCVEGLEAEGEDGVEQADAADDQHCIVPVTGFDQPSMIMYSKSVSLDCECNKNRKYRSYLPDFFPLTILQAYFKLIFILPLRS